jgi:hypothetical protein
MRTIKATFEIEEDSDIAGVLFECDGNTIQWQDLTRLEQIRMLNAWVGHYKLFYKLTKEV